MRALPVDRVAYVRARAVARAATSATLALAGYAAYRMLGYAVSGDRLAMAWFVALLWVTAAGFVVLRSLWRRSRSPRSTRLHGPTRRCRARWSRRAAGESAVGT
jgi:hypothetical protein